MAVRVVAKHIVGEAFDDVVKLQDDPTPRVRTAASLVAIAGGEIVGHVLASLGELNGLAVPGIAPLAVRPDWQGRGIGTALMTELPAIYWDPPDNR